MVLPFILALVGSYLVGETYKRYATPQHKQKWENFVKIHHGEAGILMTGVGILTKSPTLTATGIGLIVHDRNDHKKWFTGDKRQIKLQKFTRQTGRRTIA